ncbi:MAG TPA: ATP synthase F0 subunit B [Pyrinomonadaceae bacterium]|nr:ATP synthase F0 subunit B [Pyrinomonadaceae bacterium]
MLIALSFLLPEWIETYGNYPGLEAWKFLNLIIFIVAVLILHSRFGKPIKEAFRSRAEGIKSEIARAQEERDTALAKLAEIEARFGNLEAELSGIREKASAEGAAEKQRLSAAADDEIKKIREQAKREIESAGKAARQELRRFAAGESVRLAEEILKREIRPEDDARLTSMSVQQFGRTSA